MWSRRRSQVVRQRFAKPPYTGSNPVGASIESLCVRPSLRRCVHAAVLGAELDLVKSDYYLVRAEQRENVFTPWRVRPLGNLSLGARF